VLLLDTHAFLWIAQGMTRRFSPSLRERLEDGPPQALGGVSFYEVAQLIRRRRLPVSMAWFEVQAEGFVARGGVIAEADHAVMARAGALDWDHGDPFDRLIVATAMERELDLLTKDRAIAAFYPRAVG